MTMVIPTQENLRMVPLNGQGTFKSHEGWIYQGEFKSGQADGQGKLTTENKVTYKGKFKQGIFKG